MSTDYASFAYASFNLPEMMKSEKLRDGLVRWAQELHAGMPQLTPINISGAPQELYPAVKELADRVVTDSMVAGEFVSVLHDLTIVAHDYHLVLRTDDLNIDMTSEILRLFIILNPTEREWRVSYGTGGPDAGTVGVSGGGIISVTPESIETWTVEELFDRFKDLNRDDRHIDDDED